VVAPRAGRHGLALAALASLVVIVVLRYDLVPSLRGPAPYPPEWQWRYRAHAIARALPVVPVGLGLVALLAASGSAVARRRPQRTAAALLGAGTLLGLIFPLALLTTEDGGAVAFLVSRTSSPAYLSYHTVARSPAAADIGDLLRQYPERLPQLPEHAATHPPGPVLFYKALLAGLPRVPAVEAALERRVMRSCGASGQRCSAAVAQETPQERAAALAGALSAHVLAVLTLLPIAWLAFQLTRDPLAAARTAVLWPLVPGVALFIPSLDPMLSLPVVGALASARLALSGTRRWTRTAGAVLTGGCAALAVFLSYGALLLLPLGLLTVLASLPRYVVTRGRLVPAIVGSATAAVLVTAIPMHWGGYDPVRSAQTALGIHALQFTAHRSYALWLLFGPLDFALFLGLPIAIGIALHVARGARTSPPFRFACAFAVAFVVLIASGLVRGEVGRILVPWMGLGLVAGVLRLDDDPAPDAFAAATVGAILVAFDVVMRLSWRL
jgi:hypothetical protein